jgi:predicted acetyltransferase
MNSMDLQLINPGPDHESSYRAYINELGDEVRYPFPMDFDHSDFPALLRRLQDLRDGIDLPEGYVPSSTYWLVQGLDLLGVSNLRSSLTNKLRYAGGHIGLGIRPSQRGRGLGTELLRLTIAEARKSGLGTLHVHCYRHNIPSARMIMANGGVLESEVPLDDKVVQRYLIDPA